MSWPSAEEYNAAIQSPELCFGDPELTGATPVCNAMGLPVPRSGAFAAVYQLQGPSGSAWAVKCFTKPAPGRVARYAAVHQYLPGLNLPFLIKCEFLEKGIWVNEQWFPIVKMDWVEGHLLHEFARDTLNNPPRLEKLFTIWAKLVASLESQQIVHGDFQHGNILVVPGEGGSRGAVTLVDYDGMSVPGLGNVSIDEVGHPAYQHPTRIRQKNASGPGADRFPALVIATALRGLRVAGRELWDRFHEDNLLFKQKDFENPEASAVFREFCRIDDDVARRLVDALVTACREPMENTPPLSAVLDGSAVNVTLATPEANTPQSPAGNSNAPRPAFGHGNAVATDANSTTPTTQLPSGSTKAVEVEWTGWGPPGTAASSPAVSPPVPPQPVAVPQVGQPGNPVPSRPPQTPQVAIPVAVAVVALPTPVTVAVALSPPEEEPDSEFIPDRRRKRFRPNKGGVPKWLQIAAPVLAVGVVVLVIVILVRGVRDRSGDAASKTTSKDTSAPKSNVDGSGKSKTGPDIPGPKTTPTGQPTRPENGPQPPIVPKTAGEVTYPAIEIAQGKIKVPDFSQYRLLTQTSFDRPLTEKLSPAYLFANGQLSIRSNGNPWWRVGGGLPDEYACEVVCRVTGNRTAQGGLVMTRPGADKRNRGIQVLFGTLGTLTVEAWEYDADRKRGPTLPPIRHTALKEETFNTLTTVVRGRRLEVYVNGVAVCNPIEVESSFAGEAMVQGTGADAQGWADFKQVRIWALDGRLTPFQEPR